MEESIIAKIEETLNKDRNIFQKIGWKVLEFMWNSLFENRNYQSENRYY